ncbi:cytochrome bd oxidase small subunit CydS [Caldifermentibacillus hisashii]
MKEFLIFVAPFLVLFATIFFAFWAALQDEYTNKDAPR